MKSSKGAAMLHPYKRFSGLGRRRQGQHRTLWEKVERSKHEVMPHNRHDRPVLGASDVVETECVPGHDVGVFDRAIRLGPNRESVVTLASGVYPTESKGDDTLA